MRIESMSKQEQPAKPLPVDDSVIVKLPEGKLFFINSNNVLDTRETPYTSTKKLVDKLVSPLIACLNPNNLLKEGIEAAILVPGKTWIKGKIRVRLVYEFIPEEPEADTLLDDIRQLNL